MEKFQIKNRFTGSVIFECEAESMRECVAKAVKEGAYLSDAYLRDAYLSDAYLRDANLSDAYLRDAYLSDAYLRDANLSDADLRDANLSRAYLRDANLSDADLRDANLSRAYLRDANLSGADLSGANLSRAYLRDADLSRAYLRDANLSGAYLRDANLSDADLSDAKEDIFEKLGKVKEEVVGLYKTLHEGRINGSCYEGECSCFCGTISNLKQLEWNKKEFAQLTGIVPDGSSPTERWFLAIRKGDTPKSNKVAEITSQWLEEFMQQHNISIPKMRLVWK